MKYLPFIFAILATPLIFGQVPVVNDFNPTSGPIGSVVTINGSNFDPTPANNFVYFGSVKATVSQATASQLIVTAPLGINNKPISVTTNGLTAYSKNPFVITFNSNGNLDGTSFNAKKDFASSAGTRQVTSGDIDGDGKPDLAVAYQAPSGGFNIFRNASTPGIINSSSIEAYDYFPTGSNTFGTALGDLDGDGKLDVVVANETSNTVSILRSVATPGTISGTSFEGKIDFTTGTDPLGVVVADFDGDGKPDIATANYSGSSVSVFRNTTTAGSFSSSSFAGKLDYGTAVNPYNITVADFDGDNKIDIAVSSLYNAVFSVLRNTSTQGNISFAAKSDFTALANRCVAVGDLDLDGKPDIVVANYNAATISVLRNTSTSVISFAAGVSFSTGTNPTWIAIGDLNGDTKPEILVANEGSASISVFKNLTTQGSIISNSFAFCFNAATNPTPRGVCIVDLDMDGKMDFVSANGGSGFYSISVFRNLIDSSLPVISSINAPTSVDAGATLNFSADVTDPESGILGVVLQFKTINGEAPNNFISRDMTLAPGSTTSFSTGMSSSEVSQLGIEYKLIVTNGAGLVSSVGPYKAIVHHPQGLTIDSYPSDAAGPDAANYRMVSIPLVLDKKTADDVFGGALGNYDRTKWRMFHYNGSSFDELNGQSNLIPGEGYFFITNVTGQTFNTGSGSSVDVSTASPFTITLKPGWNQIGNPYNFSIAWSDVVAANPTQSLNLGGNNSKIRVFRGSVDNTNVLKPMEGGFVKYLGNSSTSIVIPVAKNPSIQGRVQSQDNDAASLDEDAWEVSLQLKNGTLINNLGGFGMNPNAKEGFDYHDDFNAPRFIEYIEVKFPKKHHGMSYTKDIVATQENYVWRFNVESNLKEAVGSLNWDNSRFGNGRGLFLVDVSTQMVTDMRSQSHYEFNHTTSGEFKVVIGNPEFIKQEIIPEAAVLFEPYPNPFNRSVTVQFALPEPAIHQGAEIEIYNSTGSLVSTTHVEESSGFGSRVLDGENYSPGMYFIRLRTGQSSVTKKLIKQ